MLKIGDRVRAIGEATRANDKLVVLSWAYGTIGDTTSEHDNSGLLYRVDWDEGGYDWLCSFELTKTEEDTAMSKIRKVVKTVVIVLCAVCGGVIAVFTVLFFIADVITLFV